MQLRAVDAHSFYFAAFAFRRRAVTFNTPYFFHAIYLAKIMEKGYKLQTDWHQDPHDLSLLRIKCT